MRILSFLSTNIKHVNKECEMRIGLPYNVKKAYLMMLLAMGLTPVFTSCEKDGDEIQPKHDTTYIFGSHTALPADSQIKASADSSQVRNVILQSDGLSTGGVGSDAIITYLSPKFAISPKIKGKGNLKDVWVKSVGDSLQCVAWGYTVNQR